MAFSFGSVGRALNLPELGISEQLGGNKNSLKNQKTQNISSAIYWGMKALPQTQAKSNTQTNPQNNTQNTNNFGGGGQVAGSSSQRSVSSNDDGGLSSDYLRQVEDVFGETDNLLSNLYKQTQAGEQNFYNSYTQPYDAQMPILQQSKDESLAANAGTVQDERLREQNAISSARNLYNELATGTRQRFGGVGSTAEFANNILGRQLMQNLGQVQNTTGANIQKLALQAQSIRDDYTAKVQSLTQQKDAALAQARDAFQQRLMAINNAQIGSAQAKAEAKLSALQELRQRAYQIQDQATAYQQQLDLMTKQASTNLQQMIASSQSQWGQQVPLNAQSNPMFSRYGGGNATAYSDINAVSRGRKSYDDMSNNPFASSFS